MLKLKNMRIISSKELSQNITKYLDLAATEEVIIQRDNKETFVLQKREYLKPDEDLYRAITAEELLVGIKSDIHKIYASQKP